MAEPVEMVKGGQRQTVYSEIKASSLEQEGWLRVKSLTPEQLDALANMTPEKQLEAETGHEVVKSGDNPPTYVEMDAPAPDQATSGGIVPENDVPAAMNQGRLKRRVPRG